MGYPLWQLEVLLVGWCKAVFLTEHKVYLIAVDLVVMLLEVSDVGDHDRIALN